MEAKFKAEEEEEAADEAKQAKAEAEAEPHDTTCLSMNSKQWLNATGYGNARSNRIGAQEFPMAQGPLLDLDIQSIVIGHRPCSTQNLLLLQLWIPAS